MCNKNSRQAYILTNHKLTPAQEEELSQRYKCEQTIYPDKSMRNYWSNISPEGQFDLNKLHRITDKISKLLKENDVVVVQGEFGCTFYVVDFCNKMKFTPLYAASSREYTEVINPDGSVQRNHLFRHVQFREYIKYD